MNDTTRDELERRIADIIHYEICGYIPSTDPILYLEGNDHGNQLESVTREVIREIVAARDAEIQSAMLHGDSGGYRPAVCCESAATGIPADSVRQYERLPDKARIRNLEGATDMTETRDELVEKVREIVESEVEYGLIDDDREGLFICDAPVNDIIALVQRHRDAEIREALLQPEVIETMHSQLLYFGTTEHGVKLAVEYALGMIGLGDETGGQENDDER